MNMLSAITAKNIERPFAAIASVAEQSAGVNDISNVVRRKLTSVTPAYEGSRAKPLVTLNERLFDVRAKFKILISQVAMHLTDEWRARLFSQLDSLLDAEQWEDDDLPPKLASFQTFLRMLLLLQSPARPGLGASHSGNIIAAWTRGDDRLTIECLERDQVRWSLTTTIDGDRVRAAGVDMSARLPIVLAAYEPNTWFKRAE